MTAFRSGSGGLQYRELCNTFDLSRPQGARETGGFQKVNRLIPPAAIRSARTCGESRASVIYRQTSTQAQTFNAGTKEIDTVHPTSIDIPEQQRAEVVQLLNSRLADLIDLQLQAKQAHWNVKGPHFIALHELFDGVFAALTGHIDATAERIAALGGTAEGTLAAVQQRTSLPPYPVTLTDGMQHVEKLSKAVALAGKAVRADIVRSAELGDQDTADLLTGVSRDLDQQLWFLEAHLQK
jgi:starvation-inducible DNA-binding protein